MTDRNSTFDGRMCWWAYFICYGKGSIKFCLFVASMNRSRGVKHSVDSNAVGPYRPGTSLTYPIHRWVLLLTLLECMALATLLEARRKYTTVEEMAPEVDEVDLDGIAQL